MAQAPPAPRARGHVLALVAAALVPVLVAAMAVRLTGSSTAWLTPFIVAVSAAVAAAALATVVAVARDVAWLRAGLPALLLAALVPFIVACQVGASPLRVAAFPSLAHAIALGAITVVAVVGLVTRRLWGRWLGLALGGAAIGSGGLNAIAFLPATRAFDHAHADWSITMFETEWAQLVGVVVGLLLVVNLATAGRAFRAGRADPTLASDAPVIRSVRWLIVAALMAVPMLLVYALTQPLGPATRASALALAAVIGLGAIATVRGRVLGVLTLTVAGLGLIGQTVATYLAADGAAARHIAGYYAVFWLPAGAIAFVASLRVIGPTRRILRS